MFRKIRKKIPAAAVIITGHFAGVENSWYLEYSWRIVV